jgi:hypothetical protein
MNENPYDLIVANAYAAYRNCLVGKPAPRVYREYERRNNPQPGDLVMEISTRRRDGLGTLRSIDEEPIMGRVEYCEAWLEGNYWGASHETDTYADLPTERVFYVEALDPTQHPSTMRWVNADFIAINRDLGDLADDA